MQIKEKKAQRLKDFKANNYIFQSINQSILETIFCKKTSKDIWDSTRKKYKGTTKVKRQQIQVLQHNLNCLG
jgi:hypothetical protein